MSNEDYLRSLWGDAKYDQIKAAWDAAPVDGILGLRETVESIAVLACLDRFGVAIDDLSKPQRDRILVAVLDALPGGEGEAEEAAAEAMRAILDEDGYPDGGD